MITNTLLFIIAISEVARLVLTHRPQSEKAHFKSKLQGVRQMVWDLRFKRYKTKEIREDVRKEYDNMCSRIASIDTQIEAFPKDGNQDEKGRLTDTKTLAERDRDRFLAQMKQLDLEVDGCGKTADYPDGVAGIIHQIDSLNELEGMLESWIKQLK